jgi:inner membrane protein COX18
MITFANVESAKWFISEKQKTRQERVEKWNEEKRAQGHTVVEPKKIVQNALRVMSVGRILISAVVPGVCVQPSSLPSHSYRTRSADVAAIQAVEIYWLASASFGLVQTWAFDWISYRREKNRRPSPPLSPSGKPLRMI